MNRNYYLWVFSVLVCIIGLLGQLSLAVKDSRANPAPAFTMPFFWLWVVSPTLGWALSSFCLRDRFRPSIILVICASISSIGGWWLLWRDAHWVPTGGRNPFLATSGILMSLTIYPVLHWAFFLFSLLLCFLSVMNWQRNSSPENGDKS